MKFTFTAQDISGERLDVFLRDNISDYSRSFIAKSIKNNAATVNKKTAKAAAILKAGDLVEIELSAPTSENLVPIDAPLDIIFEDDWFVIINKPQGQSVHPGAGGENNTVANVLRFHYGENLSDKNGALRPGIVHRLDKNTSGVLVAAKNNLAHARIAEQFARREVIKKYCCVTQRVMPNENGEIERPIGRCKTNRKKMAVCANGKNAVTYYKVLERFARHTYLEITPKTGRTHQIRAHMAYIGYPIAGDTLYGAKTPFPNEPPLSGQALHAGYIGFFHPNTNTFTEFEAPLPEYFCALLEQLRKI